MTYVVVVISIALQGLTIGPLVRRTIAWVKAEEQLAAPEPPTGAGPAA